jgi:phosphoserine aminotransferase
LEDLKARGGVAAMEQRAIRHSGRLYNIIDQSKGFYSNHVDAKYRSRMNVCLLCIIKTVRVVVMFRQCDIGALPCSGR